MNLGTPKGIFYETIQNIGNKLRFPGEGGGLIGERGF